MRDSGGSVSKNLLLYSFGDWYSTCCSHQGKQDDKNVKETGDARSGVTAAMDVIVKLVDPLVQVALKTAYAVIISLSGAVGGVVKTVSNALNSVFCTATGRLFDWLLAIGVAVAAPLKNKMNLMRKIVKTEEAISTVTKIIDGTLKIVDKVGAFATKAVDGLVRTVSNAVKSFF
ncbi:hypothetical protein QYM36_001834, partial [Artemia franciscana]